MINPLLDPFAALAAIKAEEGGREPPNFRHPHPQLPPAVAEVNIDIHQELIGTSATSATSAAGHSRAEKKAGSAILVINRIFSSSSRDSTCAHPSVVSSDQWPARDCENTPAEVAEVADLPLSVCDKKNSQKSAAAELPPLADLGGGSSASWRVGFARLDPNLAPCAGYSPTAWTKTYRDLRVFLDEWAEEAASLGWMESELFGVHPEAGAMRADCTGAIALGNGGRVASITADEVRFANKLVYRRKHAQPVGTPLWDLTLPPF